MSKRTYKSVSFKDADVKKLVESFEGNTLVVATDVAKYDMYTALADPMGEVEQIVTWKNTDELETFGGFVDELGSQKVILVIEPSGTYAEPLRQMAQSRHWETRLMSPKRVHDAAELFDGVPSLHDPKCAWLLAKLHAQGLSQPWGADDDDDQRRLNAYIKTMNRYDNDKRRNLQKMEAELAKFWPELTNLIARDSATLLALLAKFGGPAQVASHREEARKVMRCVSKRQLSENKIEAIIQSADETVGVDMHEAERQMVSELASDTERLRTKAREWKRKLEGILKEFEDAEAVGEVVGKTTAAVFRAQIGDFRDYHSPAGLLKSFGLNLKEKSSGTHQGQMHISKRGPGESRKYLYLTVLRLIHSNAIFRAWHKKKVDRDGGVAKKSIVALMRKLVKGLWHVARGKEFDATKLFDVSRLKMANG